MIHKCKLFEEEKNLQPQKGNFHADIGTATHHVQCYQHHHHYVQCYHQHQHHHQHHHHHHHHHHCEGWQVLASRLTRGLSGLLPANVEHKYISWTLSASSTSPASLISSIRLPVQRYDAVFHVKMKNKMGWQKVPKVWVWYSYPFSSQGDEGGATSVHVQHENELKGRKMSKAKM